jgi:hypothetical protein
MYKTDWQILHVFLIKYKSPKSMRRIMQVHKKEDKVKRTITGWLRKRYISDFVLCFKKEQINMDSLSFFIYQGLLKPNLA